MATFAFMFLLRFFFLSSNLKSFAAAWQSSLEIAWTLVTFSSVSVPQALPL